MKDNSGIEVQDAASAKAASITHEMKDLGSNNFCHFIQGPHDKLYLARLGYCNAI